MMQPVCLPERVPADVEVWRLALDEAGTTVSAHGLSADEIERMRRFRHEADARRFACARRGLRVLLARRLGTEPQSLVFARGEHGKPVLAAAQRGTWEFSVSHSARAALLALSHRRAVGVDVEFGRADMDLAAIASISLTADERARVAQAEDEADFYRHWVAKEAVLKALGLGIGQHMQQLTVTPTASGVYRLRHCLPGAASGAALAACALPAPAGYFAALAWLSA